MSAAVFDMEQPDLFDQPIPTHVEILTFNQAMRLFKVIHWSRTKMGRKTEALTAHMVRCFDGRLYHHMGRQDVLQMRKFLEGLGLGLSYINKAHRILKIMGNKYEGWHSDGWAGGFNFERMLLPRKNPATFVPIPKDPARDRFTQPWEYRKLVKLAKRLNDWDLVDLLRGAVWWKLSPIDLEHLNDDEIDEARWQIKVRRRHTMTPRNPEGELQIIPLTEKSWGMIARRRLYRRPGDKLIFNCKNLKRRIGRLRKLAVAEGMKDFTLSDLRKAGPGYLYARGVSLKEIADSLGHSTEKTTAHHYVPQIRPHLKRQTKMTEEAFS